MSLCDWILNYRLVTTLFYSLLVFYIRSLDQNSKEKNETSFLFNGEKTEIGDIC